MMVNFHALRGLDVAYRRLLGMQFTIGFGLGFDRDGKALDATQRAELIKLVLTEASLRFGGANLTFGQGAWINPAGALVVEESATLVVQPLHAGRLAGDWQREADALAEYIRRLFNQEAVLLTQTVATSRLVSSAVRV